MKRAGHVRTSHLIGTNRAFAPLRVLTKVYGIDRPTVSEIKQHWETDPKGCWIAIADGITVMGTFEERAGVLFFDWMDAQGNPGQASYGQVAAWRFLPLDNDLMPKGVPPLPPTVGGASA